MRYTPRAWHSCSTYLKHTLKQFVGRIANPPYGCLMTISELTELMHSFVASKGWYRADSARPQTAKNLAVSLCLESAEVLEHFQWRDVSADSAELASELADVALYLLQLASISDIDLEQAILDKLALNHTREWPKN